MLLPLPVLVAEARLPHDNLRVTCYLHLGWVVVQFVGELVEDAFEVLLVEVI
ncbi:Uncharacterised protein [Mycobacteroides abscessus subsp. abscessus]|nr:Uncharacterised protein [Mycobacteroides abscessus subsp. abscessus]